MNYIDLFEITIIVVIIVDISGFIDSIKNLIGKVLGINNVKLKPLDCSLCMTFWVSMVYLVIASELSITAVMVALLLSTMTPVIGDLVYLVRDLIGKIINNIRKNFFYFQKIFVNPILLLKTIKIIIITYFTKL